MLYDWVFDTRLVLHLKINPPFSLLILKEMGFLISSLDFGLKERVDVGVWILFLDSGKSQISYNFHYYEVRALV